MAEETTLDQVMDGSMAHSDSLQQRLVVVVDLLVIFYNGVPQRGRNPHFNCQLENMSCFITYSGGLFSYVLFSYITRLVF